MTRTRELPEKKKRLLRLLDLLRMPVLAMFGTVSFILFFILNRTSVSGREHLPKGTNVILACRHQSLIDSFPVTIASMHFRDMFCPWNLPWHTPDALNYMKSPVFKGLGWYMKCLGIKRNRSGVRVDTGNLIKMAIVTQYSRLFVFPGGTRERPDRELRPQLGIGHVAALTGATIIPIWIDGMDQVLPIGCSLPRLFKSIRIIFGPPVYYQDLINADPNRSRETKTDIVYRTVEAIYKLSERPETNPPIKERRPVTKEAS